MRHYIDYVHQTAFYLMTMVTIINGCHLIIITIMKETIPVIYWKSIIYISGNSEM